MENKAFNLITDNIENILKTQSFNNKKVNDSPDEKKAIFEGKSIAYQVSYNYESKKYTLSSCPIVDSQPDLNWNKLSTWLFDPESNNMQDAQDIVNDFISTLKIIKTSKVNKSAKNKSKTDESNVNPLFFMNRLVNVFPELKSEITFEKEHYESFRGVTFTKEKVLPLINSLIESNDLIKIKKLCKILSDMYSSGDLDVRGIITYVILNFIDNNKKITMIEEYLSPELKKSFQNTRKIKGKKIKPEKKRKPSKLFSAATLADR